MGHPTLLRRICTKFGVYDYLRYSRIYPTYSKLLNRQSELEKRDEIHFYKDLFRTFKARDVIFDVGASGGFKTEIFSRLGAMVIAIEPDRNNAVHLRRTFRFMKRVSIVEKAVSDGEGKATFYVFEAGSGYNTLQKKWVDSLRDPNSPRFGEPGTNPLSTYEVATTTLNKLIEEFGLPYYVKIDIEGNELASIRGLAQMVPFLSFEANLPEFRSETIQCIEHLNKLSRSVTFNWCISRKMESPQWLAADEMKKWVEITTLRYFEMYSRME